MLNQAIRYSLQNAVLAINYSMKAAALRLNLPATIGFFPCTSGYATKDFIVTVSAVMSMFSSLIVAVAGSPVVVAVSLVEDVLELPPPHDENIIPVPIIAVKKGCFMLEKLFDI